MRLLLQAPGANPPHARMHAGPMRRTMTHIAAPPITPRRPARKANARGNSAAQPALWNTGTAQQLRLLQPRRRPPDTPIPSAPRTQPT